MVITELGRMGVKPGLQVMDESKPEGQVMPTAYKKTTTLPGGPQRSYWGLQTEEPSWLWAFHDFNSVAEHESFAKEHGMHVVADLPTILTHGEYCKHVDVSPSPATALKAPATEVLFAYFPSDLSSERKGDAAERFGKFARILTAKSPDVHGVASGWGVENDFPIMGEDDGQKCAVFVAFIGWTSVAAHMNYRDTEDFKGSIGYLREMAGLVKLKSFHVNCRSFDREGAQ